MARSSKHRIETDGSSSVFGQDAFGSLSSSGLPISELKPKVSAGKEKKGKRHVVNIRRLTAGKGGKTVTELSGFEPDFFANRAKIALKDLQKVSGGGGTVKGKAIELQGDCRAKIQPYLEQRGYRVVQTGG